MENKLFESLLQDSNLQAQQLFEAENFSSVKIKVNKKEECSGSLYAWNWEYILDEDELEEGQTSISFSNKKDLDEDGEPLEFVHYVSLGDEHQYCPSDDSKDYQNFDTISKFWNMIILAIKNRSKVGQTIDKLGYSLNNN